MKREIQYDILKILCMFSVIGIHIGGAFFYSWDSYDSFITTYYQQHVFFSSFFACGLRFAVPCFIMISGAFLLDQAKNKNYRTFYYHIFRKIGIPTILFSFLYTIYYIFMAMHETKVAGLTYSSNLKGILWEPVKALLAGVPSYHMWYLYMMIGIIILTPWLIRLKDEIGEASFRKVAIVFLILAMCSNFTAHYFFRWDIGYSFTYLGYYMIGYCIRKHSSQKTNWWKASVSFVLALLILGGVSYVKSQEVMHIITLHLTNGVEDYYSPFIVAASLLIFYGTSQLVFVSKPMKLSSYALWIYIIHYGVWDITRRVIVRYFDVTTMDNRIAIPCLILGVFVITLLLSKIYLVVWNAIDKKWHVTDRWSKWLSPTTIS